MLLLYKDPKGETIGSITRVQPTTITYDTITQAHTNSLTISSDLEGKVASLEKALNERDAQIEQLVNSKQNLGGKETDLFSLIKLLMVNVVEITHL